MGMEELVLDVELSDLASVEDFPTPESACCDGAELQELGRAQSAEFALAPSVALFEEDDALKVENVLESFDDAALAFVLDDVQADENAALPESDARGDRDGGGAGEADAAEEAVRAWMAGVSTEDDTDGRETSKPTEEDTEAQPSERVDVGAGVAEAAKFEGGSKAADSMQSGRKRKALSSAESEEDREEQEARKKASSNNAVARAMMRAEEFAMNSLGEKKVEWNIMRRRAGLEVVDEEDGEGEGDVQDADFTMEGSQDKKNSKKYKRRLQKNRDSAYISRIRRRCYTRFLEESLGEEEAEKVRLQRRVDTLQEEVDRLKRLFEASTAPENGRMSHAVAKALEPVHGSSVASSSSSPPSTSSVESLTKGSPTSSFGTHLTQPVIRMVESTHDSVLSGLQSIFKPVNGVDSAELYRIGGGAGGGRRLGTATTMCMFVFLFGLMLPGFGPMSRVAKSNGENVQDSVLEPLVDEMFGARSRDVQPLLDWTRLWKTHASVGAENRIFDFAPDGAKFSNVICFGECGEPSTEPLSDEATPCSRSEWCAAKVAVSGALVCCAALLIDGASRAHEAVKIVGFRRARVLRSV